ncbi:hypothetical protein [Sporomusa acidovorans]|uniref:Uncharacterized protein n=1 Tax=Sporomusa acidovorans (strain ATCC 49682 / DSM 3132 / Mol) TaxID=1123286 RepID=A0ABZ3J7S5_SPOA4|nr:hypothetical protein [Sporomusa acidovorans]OZC16721.1 hypothetical protein SPACI_41920 [Sporomusa acidovorans DSM 3132]SDE04768.1 hypothetical protein SAMN04488499_100730 [Sporomusa acidovorans]
MSTYGTPVTVAAKLDRLPLSGFHYKLLTINGCAWAFDAFDVGLITFIATALSEAWQLSSAQVGILLSSGLRFTGILHLDRTPASAGISPVACPAGAGSGSVEHC